MDLDLSVESALVNGSELVGSKELPSSLLRGKGYASACFQPLCGMYRELRRRFAVTGHVGKEFAASNGVIQGCPPCVLLLNFLMNTWARSLKTGTLTTQESSAESVMTLMLRLKVTGRLPESQKTKAWSTQETALQSAREFVVDGEHLDVVKKTQITRNSSGVQKGYLMMLLKIVSRKASQFPDAFDGHHCQSKRKPA